jgi:hypothetical protein
MSAGIGWGTHRAKGQHRSVPIGSTLTKELHFNVTLASINELQLSLCQWGRYRQLGTLCAGGRSDLQEQRYHEGTIKMKAEFSISNRISLAHLRGQKVSHKPPDHKISMVSELRKKPL